MKPIFRTAMFGFMKEDVAQFISQQNREFEKKLKEKEDLAQDLRQSFEQEKEALAADSVALGALREKLLLQQKNKEQLAALKNEFCRARDQFLSSLEKGDAAVGAMKEELERLRDHTKEMEELRVKAEKFDALAGALSGIMGQAADAAPAAEKTEERVYFTASPGTAEQSMEEQKEAAQTLSLCFDSILALLDSIDFAE